MEINTYIGPYVKCKIPVIKRKTTKRICPNTNCSNNNEFNLNDFYTYCFKCGTKIEKIDKDIEIKENPSLSDTYYLYYLEPTSNYYSDNYHYYIMRNGKEIIGVKNISKAIYPDNDCGMQDTEESELNNINSEQELSNFIKEIEEDIKILSKLYLGKIECKWGNILW